MICDLHAHSYFSDGTDSPRELVKLAAELGIGALALTDHNTAMGLAEFCDAASEYGIKAVPGIEFSTDYNNIELHMLGLFIKEKYYSEITEYVAPMMRRKAEANDELVRRLAADGYVIDYERAKRQAGGQINRAHIATELIAGGYVSTPAEAFETLLKKNGKYYTVAKRIDVFEVISYIKSIGGVCVLAHPFLELKEDELRTFLPRAREAGLDGMEVYYSKFDAKTVDLAKRIADEYGILASGGSDYHGWRKPGVKLGVGSLGFTVDGKIYEALRERAKD